MKKIILFLLIIVSSITYSQNTCPVTGDTKGTSEAKANHRKIDSFKNRGTAPTKYTALPFATMMNLTVTNSMTWDTAVYIEGYILDIQDGGSESCNCHSSIYKDTHIYIVQNSIGDVSKISKKDLHDLKLKNQENSVIVEATPRFRSTLGTTEDLEKLIGKHVRVYGYLFRDDEHKSNSTIDKGKGNHWRHTVWEIHPITKIETIP